MTGRVIGDFQILREIGRGGMAVVYEARQLSLDRIVALKVLSHTSGLSDSAVARFRREAQAAAKLHHPNIIPIFAQGEEAGTYYYAMELVKGRTVHQLMWAERGVKDAPGPAGSADAPPADTDETVLLSDPSEVPGSRSGGSAGLPAAASGGGASRRTAEHFDTIARQIAAVASALDYAHQCGVIHRDIKPQNLMISHDGRISVSDFGLARITAQPGVTVTGEFIGSPLYMSPEQIMSGHLRVDHRTDIYSLGATLYEWLTLVPPFPGETRELVISRIINSDPPAPRSHDSRIPIDLETICLKALEKDPARRYQTAGDMRDDLSRYLARRTIRARRAGPMARFKKLVLRNRVAVMAALAAVVAVSSGMLAYREYRRSKVSVAEHKAKVHEQSEQIAAVEQKRSELELEREALLRAITERVYDLSKPVLAAEAREKRRTHEIAAKFASDLLRDLRRTERERLEAQAAPSQPEPAEEFYLGAIASDNFAVALAMVNQSLQSRESFSARRLRAVVSCGIRAFEDMRADGEALVAAREDSCEGFLIRGAARLFAGRPADAVADFGQAIARGGDSAWLHTLSGLGRLRQRHYASAKFDFTRALAIDPTHTVALMGRARCLFKVRNYNAAIADLSRVIEMNPNADGAYVLRGECLDQLERYDESIADYLRANTLTGGSLSILAKIALAQANKQRKEQTAREATDAAPPASPTGGVTLPTGDVHRDWLQEFLDRLQSRAPGREGAKTPSATRVG